jgi:hypothetical protein
MKQTTQKFTVSIPIKPYVKRFLEINYGVPVDFTSNAQTNKFFTDLLRKPNTRFDNNYPEEICRYSKKIGSKNITTWKLGAHTRTRRNKLHRM